MRNLTIKRTKSFVACLGKMKVYIEDPSSSDITINDIHCRKLGTLKNGDEQTFQIDDNAAKVYVIADKISKNYCNEYYQLPEGTDDIFLSGKNKFNPAAGNAFLFDNNQSEGITANRRRNTKKGLIILAVALIIGAVAGYAISSHILSSGKAKPKDFSSDGMTITLTEEFNRFETGVHTACYGTDHVAVFALKESFDLLEGSENFTLKEYAELVIKANGFENKKPKTDNGLTYFEYDYTNPETKQDFRYFSYVYKANDSFWFIQFAILTDEVNEYKDDVIKWAKSVTFSD